MISGRHARNRALEFEKIFFIFYPANVTIRDKVYLDAFYAELSPISSYMQLYVAMI